MKDDRDDHEPARGDGAHVHFHPDAELERLAPGEIWVGPKCEHGMMTYALRREDGTLERALGHDGRYGLGDSDFITIEGSNAAPGIKRIKDHIRFTARGPRQVSTQSYRDGWQRIYGQN